MSDFPENPQYQVARVRRALLADPRTAEQGIQVDIRGDQVVLTGEVASARRRADLDEVLREVVPEFRVLNEVRVVSAQEPDGREELR